MKYSHRAKIKKKQTKMLDSDFMDISYFAEPVSILASATRL